MKKNNFFKSVVFLTAMITLFACKKATTTAPVLTVSVSTMSFAPEGGSQDITVTSNADWSINNPASSWLQLSVTSGKSGSTVIHVIATSPNGTGASQSAILEISASNGQARRVTVTQAPNLYPSYNTSPIAPDMTGMPSNAVQLAANFKMGINFGNTMESPNEGDWQTSKMTLSYVKYVKSLGFNFVRLPCNWVWTHLSDPKKAKIDTAWLARVKQVVGWCVANDIYVVLNSHDDPNVSALKADSVNAMQKALWEQIATTMRDFDEHLIFAGANENAVSDAAGMAILNGYNETFINAVRSTGGRNSYRELVVQAPNTSATEAVTLMNTLPADKIPNKLMVEVHNYTPSVFTILTSGDVSWGKMVYYWGAGNHSTIEPDRNATFGEEDEVAAELMPLKAKFVDKGIPVIMGEYSAWRRTAALNSPYVPKDTVMSNRSVDYWTTYTTKTARAAGLMPFFWEIGFMLDRSNNVVIDQRMYNAIVAGYK